MVIITKHGEKRMRKRTGVPKRSVAKIALKVLRNGVKHCETVGNLRLHLDELYARHMKANNIVVFGEKAYLFVNEILITVLPLPSMLFKDAHAACQRKKYALAMA